LFIILAHRKASLASVVYAMCGIRLSVTLRYYVKMMERRGMQSLPAGIAHCLWFSDAKNG